MSRPPDADLLAFAAIALLVVFLIVIRTCFPPAYHATTERPLTPPESLYTPGG